MKLTVLGSRAAFPNKDEGCSGYLLQDNDYNLLIDCGSGVVSALQNYIQLEDLSAVVLSHYHADHWSDIRVLQHGMMIKSIIERKDKSIKIYSHDQEEYFNDLNYKGYTKAIAYQKDSLLTLGNFHLSFLQTDHSAPCYAMKILVNNKKIVYTADTAYFEGLIDFAKDCDLLIAESSLYPEDDAQEIKHMNSIEVADLATKANCKRVLLTHLPNYGDNLSLLSTARKDYQGKIELAHSGWIYQD